MVVWPYCVWETDQSRAERAGGRSIGWSIDRSVYRLSVGAIDQLHIWLFDIVQVRRLFGLFCFFLHEIRFFFVMGRKKQREERERKRENCSFS